MCTAARRAEASGVVETTRLVIGKNVNAIVIEEFRRVGSPAFDH